MGKRVLIIVLVVLIVIAVIFGLTRNNDKNWYSSQSNTNTSQPAANQQQNNTQSQQKPAAAANTVSIENFAFMPPDTTVKKGTTVTWTNNDSTAHTVTEMDGQPGPNSGNLNPGAKYTFTFNQTGTFKYRCDIHTYMLGTVTVTE
jgi:plastocyanin